MSSELRRIGLLGGTFDPIHDGHIDLANAAALAVNLQRVFFVASNVPPHRSQPFASAFHRFAMVSLAIAGRPGWEASDVELRSPAPSYTTTTLRSFHEQGFRPAELFFVIGADAFVEITTWRDYPAILDAAHFAVVSRPGTSARDMPAQLPALASRMVLARPSTFARPVIILIDAPTADVSATAIRERRGTGESIAGLVPPAVQQHIEQHGLYSTKMPDGRDAHSSAALPAGRLHGQD